jgi:hypothetical protein
MVGYFGGAGLAPAAGAFVDSTWGVIVRLVFVLLVKGATAAGPGVLLLAVAAGVIGPGAAEIGVESFCSNTLVRP